MPTEKLKKFFSPENIAALKSSFNPYQLFNILFGIYFFLLNLKIFSGIDFILGKHSVAKSDLQGFYRSDILNSLYNLPDNFFMAILYLNMFISLFLIFTRYTRIPMLLLWLGLTLLFIRIPAHKSVHIEYLGWLMLINVFISDDVRRKKMELPAEIKWAIWIFFAGSYFLSGIAKLRVPEWTSGSAIYYILQTDVARYTFLRDLMLSHKNLTLIPNYFVLLVELAGIGLIWRAPARMLFWLCSFSFHLMILTFLKISDLTIAILIFHLFMLITFYRPLGTIRTGNYN